MKGVKVAPNIAKGRVPYTNVLSNNLMMPDRRTFSADYIDAIKI
jgi:hypothetical protein